MKQFSLNEYLANPSRKVVTRDGHSVRIICTDADGKAPVVALIKYEDEEIADKWAVDVRTIQSDIKEAVKDFSHLLFGIDWLNSLQ